MTTANGTNYYEGQNPKHGGGDLFFMLTKIVSKYPPQEREKKILCIQQMGIRNKGLWGSSFNEATFFRAHLTF